jgi:hypothetical protein
LINIVFGDLISGAFNCNERMEGRKKGQLLTTSGGITRKSLLVWGK